jgi:hypothetical protein
MLAIKLSKIIEGLYPLFDPDTGSSEQLSISSLKPILSQITH